MGESWQQYQERGRGLGGDGELASCRILLLETAMEAPRYWRSSDVHCVAESAGQGDGLQEEGAQSILWKHVGPGSHFFRSTTTDGQIFHRKSSLDPKLLGFSNQKCRLSSAWRPCYCCHRCPSWESRSCIPAVPGGCGRAGVGRAEPRPWGSRGSSIEGGSGDTPVPGPAQGWGRHRGLSSMFLSCSSVSHRLRTHQPGLPPAGAHHPAAAARR